MLRRALILRIFNAFTIQRWNDQIRPVPMVEMDKHGHKMAIAYCLARYAESEGKTVPWHNLIRRGIFELLRRSVLSDIKSPVYRKLRTQYPEVFQGLSKWVYQELEPEVSKPDLLQEFKDYLLNDKPDTLSGDILAASHIYASYWEFQIIRRASPENETIRRIENTMFLDLAQYRSLSGLKRLFDREPVAAFVDLVGQLRFQVRWGQTPRVPLTSVLGHSMMVAALSYLLTRELSSPCEKRLRNNFFGGLFHDLPESVARDIISPVKRATPEMANAIAGIEKELVQKEIYPLIDAGWHEELDYFTRDEFDSKILKEGKVCKVTSEEINKNYNRDEYRPIDGALIRVADDLAGFVETHKSKDAGFATPELLEGYHNLKKKYKNKKVAGLNIGSIYADF